MSKKNSDPGKSRSPIIVALDYSTVADAMVLVDKLDPAACRLKVGKQLFTAAGPGFVRLLVKSGYDVFLDLKFHDIPNTAASACKAAADLGVWMVNVHASGGRRMMEAARQAIDPNSGPLLIAVSVLTSMTETDLKEMGVARTVAEQVSHLSLLAFDCGLDGLVCSAHEATDLKQKFGTGFSLVTPGIRTSDTEKGDQRRIMTPEAAIAAGSDYLVIGRSITESINPLDTLTSINKNLGIVL